MSGGLAHCWAGRMVRTGEGGGGGAARSAMSRSGLLPRLVYFYFFEWPVRDPIALHCVSSRVVFSLLHSRL